jgi:hypothetical protein
VCVSVCVWKRLPCVRVARGKLVCLVACEATLDVAKGSFHSGVRNRRRLACRFVLSASQAHLSELPFCVVKRAAGSRLQPPLDAVKMKCMLARPHRYLTVIGRRRLHIRLHEPKPHDQVHGQRCAHTEPHKKQIVEPTSEVSERRNQRQCKPKYRWKKCAFQGDLLRKRQGIMEVARISPQEKITVAPLHRLHKLGHSTAQ